MSIAERRFYKEVQDILEYKKEHGYVDSAEDDMIMWAYERLKELEESGAVAYHKEYLT